MGAHPNKAIFDHRSSLNYFALRPVFLRQPNGIRDGIHIFSPRDAIPKKEELRIQ